jgi:PEGA domain/Protein tyrosine and serine/threonine kinase
MLGSYRVVEHIGGGRLGPVYRARHESLIPDEGVSGGTVAIKVFDQGLSAEQAETLARTLTRLCDAPLDHPSIVAPNGAGLNGHTPWLAEPYVEGTPLETILQRRGSLSFAEMLLRVTQIAGALDFAAATGVFHGALHPRDILFAEDRTLVTGLGVAQALAVANVDLPLSGPAVSPQRAAGQPASRADDIFALGAITFQALYAWPLDNRSQLATLVSPLRGVDYVRLREVLQRAVADDPAERPNTALEFAKALQECAASSETVPAPEPRVEAATDRPAIATIPFSTRVDEVTAMTSVDDLPLRRALIQPTHEPEFEPALEAAQSRHTVLDLHQNHAGASSTHHTVGGTRAEQRSVWFPMVAMLAMGLLMGFAAGFVAGQRDFLPAPFTAERPVPRAARENAPEPVPTPTVGQDFTESEVGGRAPEAGGTASEVGRRASEVGRRASEVGRRASDTGPTESEAAAPPERSPATSRGLSPADNAARPQTSAEPSTTFIEQPAPNVSTGPASMEVVSRPSGAEVFIDGRMVGRTPLVLSQVGPGDYTVRISLPGHQRWATTVNVPAGSRARVAASLER